MPLRRILPAAALAAALTIPSAAHADAPWSAPAAVPGSAGPGGGAAQVLLTRTRGGAIAYNAAGSFPGVALERSLLGDGFAPQAFSPWPKAPDFDSSFGSFAAADRIIYAGSNGNKRVRVAVAPGPRDDWRGELRGPTTGGARSATAAAPHGGSAAVFSTFGSGSLGYVYLVRQPGTRALQPTQKLSSRGRIHSVAVAVNTAGDVLVAWDRSGTIEARYWIASSKRLTAVQKLGTADVASHLSAAMGAGRRAIVAWVDQRVSEGGAAKGKVMATARSASRGFLPAKQLDTYGVDKLSGGEGIEAAYTGNGMGLIGWSGSAGVQVSRVDGRLIQTPQLLAPVAADETGGFGLGDLATSPNADRAVVTWTAKAGDHAQIQAAVWPAGGNAFGPVENVSGADRFVVRPSVAFDSATNTIVTAWSTAAIPNGAPAEIDTAYRPAP
ncbi:hypothetical protein [Candidatus Solirubrobacter pratensis]|uniref:hypothetical protein n=1 Tax=Candidatus Solirubrobacter pratensis TaxID=1298857 RepID=UPI0004875971|nr:hypothetical protein [Candidatus Solirubrobacter pratensis]